jgi:hypothetical protein
MRLADIDSQDKKKAGELNRFPREDKGTKEPMGTHLQLGVAQCAHAHGAGRHVLLVSLQRDQWGLVEDLRHHDVITDTAMTALALRRIKSIHQSQAGCGACATLRYAAIPRSIDLASAYMIAFAHGARCKSALSPRGVNIFHLHDPITAPYKIWGTSNGVSVSGADPPKRNYWTYIHTELASIAAFAMDVK